MNARRPSPAPLCGILVLAAMVVGAPGVDAQEAPDPSFLSPPTAEPPVSPGGAFLRSVIIPGWGHVAVGAESRGAFYFTAAAGSAYMLLKSMSGRDAATRARDIRASFVEAELRNDGVPEDSIQTRIDDDPGVVEAQSLVESRGQQVQDWAALGIFVVLLSGADAFVSAHLMDFPEPLQIRTDPREFGRVEVGLSIPYRGPH